MTVPFLTASSLARSGGLRHAFFTRQGGVSAGIYESLNVGLGSDDAGEAVAENRLRCRRALDPDAPPLLTVHQTHSPDVVTVDAPWQAEATPRADGMATRRPGLILGVLAADCAPILLADPEARVIGAAHAGWKGALAGIAEATVAAMCALGAARERIAAAVGPAIGPESYEVGPEFRARFLDADPAHARFFREAARAEHFLFDLPGFVASRLRAAGVAAETLGRDTLSDAARFFSYRRATLAGEPDYGRQLSAIMLAG